jgi:hypothetical protein
MNSINSNDNNVHILTETTFSSKNDVGNQNTASYFNNKLVTQVLPAKDNPRVSSSRSWTAVFFGCGTGNRNEATKVNLRFEVANTNKTQKPASPSRFTSKENEEIINQYIEEKLKLESNESSNENIPEAKQAIRDKIESTIDSFRKNYGWRKYTFFSRNSLNQHILEKRIIPILKDNIEKSKALNQLKELQNSLKGLKQILENIKDKADKEFEEQADVAIVIKAMAKRSSLIFDDKYQFKYDLKTIISSNNLQEKLHELIKDQSVQSLEDREYTNGLSYLENTKLDEEEEKKGQKYSKRIHSYNQLNSSKITPLYQRFIKYPLIENRLLSTILKLKKEQKIDNFDELANKVMSDLLNENTTDKKLQNNLNQLLNKLPAENVYLKKQRTNSVNIPADENSDFCVFFCHSYNKFSGDLLSKTQNATSDRIKNNSQQNDLNINTKKEATKIAKEIAPLINNLAQNPKTPKLLEVLRP